MKRSCSQKNPPKSVAHFPCFPKMAARASQSILQGKIEGRRQIKLPLISSCRYCPINPKSNDSVAPIVTRNPLFKYCGFCHSPALFAQNLKKWNTHREIVSNKPAQAAMKFYSRFAEPIIWRNELMHQQAMDVKKMVVCMCSLTHLKFC